MLTLATLLALAGPGAASAQVTFEPRFPEGKTLRYRIRTSAHQVVNNLGMEMPSNLERTMVCSLAIGKRRKDAELPIAVKVESLRDRLRLPGGLDVSYDSKEGTTKVDKSDLDFFDGLYKVAGAAAFTVVLDAKNKVKSIEGAEALRERVDRLDPRAGDLLRSRLAPASLKAGFEQALAALPDGPTKPGAAWERTETLDTGDGLKIVLRKKYEYAGTEKRSGKTLEKINSKVLDASCRQDADSPAPLKLKDGTLKIGATEGTLLFDREAGCIVESRDRLEMKGNLTWTAQGQDQSCGIELTMRSDAQLQTGAQ